ncbi:MAG: TIM barrel protein [Balneolales bacterium]
MDKHNKNLSRRKFIKWSSGAVAAASFGGYMGCSPAGTDRGIPLGVQLYSVRHELAEDFEGTIARLAAMGFDGVEFAEFFGMAATEVKAILDEYGLRCCGNHIYFNALRGDEFEETVTFNQELGNENFIIRFIPEQERSSRDTFLRTIDEYNEVVERLDSHGMRLGYHNHDYIFEMFGDEYLWDILALNSDDRFILQLDTGHAAGMGQDPVELIRRHPGRTASIHAKAHSSVEEAAVIGDDELDWAGIMTVSEEVGGIKWYILEYEIDGVPPLEALEDCIHNFRRIRTG